MVARLIRLSNGVKGTHSPTVDERQKAERTIIKLVQLDAFEESVNTLLKSTTLPKTDMFYSLDPILQDGVLRVGGRLGKADLPSLYKHQIIFPNDVHITKLIIVHAHIRVQHQGRGITLNNLRSLGYWIIGVSKVSAKFTKRCVICRKLRRPTELQKLADLAMFAYVGCTLATYVNVLC